MRAQADASSLLSSDLAELSTIVDRITSIAALALTYERQVWLRRAADALVQLYELGFDANGFARHDVDSARLWLYVLARVHALGGLAVRLENWNAVRYLADRLPHGRDFERNYGSWLRHGLTMASRASILEDAQNTGLIARSHNVVRSVSALHPDVTPEADAVVNSLCQFDALAALVVVGERHATHRSNYYPSFARYYSERTIPAFVTVVTTETRATSSSTVMTGCSRRRSAI
jgi:hypothetical protein